MTAKIFKRPEPFAYACYERADELNGYRGRHCVSFTKPSTKHAPIIPLYDGDQIDREVSARIASLVEEFRDILALVEPALQHDIANLVEGRGVSQEATLRYMRALNTIGMLIKTRTEDADRTDVE